MIEYRCAQSSVKSKIDLTRFFPVFVFPYLGRVLDRGPEYNAVKERWVHTCVLILLRVWDEGGESGSCTIP